MRDELCETEEHHVTTSLSQFFTFIFYVSMASLTQWCCSVRGTVEAVVATHFSHFTQGIYGFLIVQERIHVYSGKRLLTGLQLKVHFRIS